MKFYIGILILTITFFGCNKEPKDANYAYFGGQIINSKCNFVVLYKSDKVLDTIILDNNNRFNYKIDNLKTGFYTFRHADEIQMVFLEPQDSIMFRLNTLDFDESLVYTGLGAKKNNYFINEFLQNERSIDYKNLYKICQLDPKAFEAAIDKEKHNKHQVLAAFENKNTTSSVFKNLAAANIEYNYNLKKEAYPIYHRGHNKTKTLESLPDDFYAFRTSINYSDSLLQDYFTYQNFLRHNITNLALKKHLEHSEDNTFDWMSVCYTIDRLHLVDSLIVNPSIKNELLYMYTSRFLAKNKIEKYNESIINTYLAKSTDDAKNKMISQYASAIKHLKPGTYLPSVTIKDYNNNESLLDSKIQSPTVICFWSLTAYNHFKDCHNKIKDLEVKYPEVSFIKINIDDFSAETIEKTLHNNRIPLKNEYLFKNPEKAKAELAIYPMIKTFIIDKNKKIVSSKSNIFDLQFEEDILGAINR